MRIVQIGLYPQSRDHICGGVEASVFGLSQALGCNNEVHVYDQPRIGGENVVESDGSVIVHRFQNVGKRQSSTVVQAKTIAQDIINMHPDVCHIHGTNLFVWKIYCFLKKEGLPLVVTIHGLASIEKKNALMKSLGWKRLGQFVYQSWVERRFIGQLSMAIVDTEYVKQMINEYRVRKHPIIQVIPQGINEMFFSIRNNCSEKSQTVLSVGAIGERKGHLYTLRAFEIVRQQGIDAKLIIAGTYADKQYGKLLQEAICGSKYRDDIELKLELSNEELRRLYGNARLFVLHTQEESQGIVFSEAMAAGLPIVATNVGGVPFVVTHGVNGLLSSYGDVELFANNIRDLLKDTSRWQFMSNNSREAASAYHWQIISDRIMELYHSER